MFWLVLLLAFAEPFWQDKPVSDWTDIQLAQFLVDSPWARSTALPPRGAPNAIPVATYLVSAPTVRKAEQERIRRAALRRKQTDDPLGEEYQVWLEDTVPSHVVLALRTGAPQAYSEEPEIRRMQADCWLKTARGKVKLGRYFPPTPRDPILRLAFSRELLTADEKTLAFELYLPGVSGPFRAVQFETKDMIVAGKPEF